MWGNCSHLLKVRWGRGVFSFLWLAQSTRPHCLYCPCFLFTSGSFLRTCAKNISNTCIFAHHVLRIHGLWLIGQCDCLFLYLGFFLCWGLTFLLIFGGDKAVIVWSTDSKALSIGWIWQLLVKEWALLRLCSDISIWLSLHVNHTLIQSKIVIKLWTRLRALQQRNAELSQCSVLMEEEKWRIG